MLKAVKTRIKVPADSVLISTQLLGSQATVFSLCSAVDEGVGGWGTLWDLFYKGSLISLVGFIDLYLITSQNSISKYHIGDYAST